jgi:hypothetical protein
MTSIPHFTRAIQSWLLGPEAQFVDGMHCGGVVGWFDEHGTPQFIYPEITGYYLGWLAFWAQLSGQVDEAARRANLALAWIAKYLSNGDVLPTRVPFGAEDFRDWRNGGSFSFDLAMLTRGVASVRNLADERSRSPVSEQLSELLLPFCEKKSTLQAFRPHVPDATYARSHWSCTQGSYQAKAAAAILSSNTVSPIPAQLHHTASFVYKHWRDHSGIPDPDGTHAAFYHLEGLALASANGWDPQAPSLIDNFFGQIIGMAETSERSDVLAQALRMGCILFDSRPNSDLIEKLRHLAERLEQFLAADGGMLFSKSPHFRHKNVWSSIFAHQALCFYAVVASGRSLGNRCLRLLI